MENAWNVVLARRWAYFITVGLTASLVVLPLVDPLLKGRVSAVVTGTGTIFRSLLSLVGISIGKAEGMIGDGIGYIPKSVAGIPVDMLVGWWRQHPLLFAVLIAVLFWLFFRKSAKLQEQVFARADYAWRNLRSKATGLQQPGRLAFAALYARRAAVRLWKPTSC